MAFFRTVTSNMDDLTGFQRDLLYVVAGLDRPKGLAVLDEISTYYDSEIHHGRLYPNLDTIVEAGFVEKGQQDRRTNYYELTNRGREAIEQRQDWVGDHVQEIGVETAEVD